MQKQSDATHSLHPATIEWRDGTPVSPDYGDVYYSSANGLHEARHVFVNHNDLHRRWRQPMRTDAHFTIIESGFGIGLNFLATWQLWRQRHEPADPKSTAPSKSASEDSSGPILHYVSIEKHPLRAADIVRTGEQWPELQELAMRLARAYPSLLPGLHSLQLDERVYLTLGFGDIVTVLDQLGDSDHPALRDATSIKADAWYLDGFAPARNPEMWSDDVFRGIASLSKPGTSFATFTAAGHVRRGLAARGFTVSKVAGYGRKRDMLRGHIEPDTGNRQGAETWTAVSRRHRTYGDAWHTRPPEAVSARTVLIAGAGLAGCHTARALAECGWQVTVLERGDNVAGAASGNPVGLLYSRLSVAASDQAAFYLASYLQACRYYRQRFANGTLEAGRDGDLQGILQLAFNDRESSLAAKLASHFAAYPEILRPLTASEASALAGIAIEQPALLYPGSGWLRPRQLCHQLLGHPNITVRTRFNITALTREANSWVATSSGGETVSAATGVLCCSLACRSLADLDWLPVRPVGGQITRLPEDAVQRPVLPLCHEGYIAPLPEGPVYCGASFRVNDASTEMRQADHRDNLAQLARHLPSALSAERARVMAGGGPEGRASVRCTSPDYLPIVGRVPQRAAFDQRFARLSVDAKTDIARPGAFYDGLYLNTAHGSKGLATTPIAAALVTALVNHTPRPLPWQLVRAVSPARFLVRELIRGQR